MTDKTNTRELALEALLLVNRDGQYSHTSIWTSVSAPF